MKSTTAHLRASDLPAIADGNKTYRQYFLFLCVFYLLLASLLAVLVQYGVMDEDFHLAASRPFASTGVNATTLYRHVPPTGVASHLWFAFWMWLFPSLNYVGLRLITCGALMLLAGAAYWHMKTISAALQRKVLAVSWFMLVSPYFFLSVSTVMTEGPALLFLFAGLLLLLISRCQNLAAFFLACLLLGFATIARFYYISLLPSVFVMLFLSDWQRYVKYGFKDVTIRRVVPYLFIGLSLLPLAGLIVLWGGLTPPLFEQWSKLRSGVSFNALRPLSALVITGVYIAPVVLVNVAWRSKAFLRIGSTALVAALILAGPGVNLLHDSSSVDDVYSGPIEHTLIWMKSGGDWALSLGLFLVYSLSFLTMGLVIRGITDLIRRKNFADKGMQFSVAFVFFFLVSQAFVGGNHPFFERYLIHPWPFIGYVLVGLFPAFFNPRTYVVLAAYTTLSVMILVKWGIQ
ncbi:hypothetical protein [Spirosoma areae]